MYPRLIIDTDKIRHNTKTIVAMSKKNSIDVLWLFGKSIS